MTRALRGDSGAPRRLRKPGAKHQETVPNPIHPPTPSPTGRWVFPRWEGLHRGQVTWHGQVHALIDGLNDGQINFRRLFGKKVCRLYHLSAG